MTYTGENTKNHGVQMIDQIVPFAGGNFKLLHADDIDWNGATPDNNEVTINTTEDLIEWIASKGNTSDNPGSEEPVAQAIEVATVAIYNNSDSNVNAPDTPDDVKNVYRFNIHAIDPRAVLALKAKGWSIDSSFDNIKYIWVSYKHFSKNGNETYESNWSTPVRFYNVDDIISTATKAASDSYELFTSGAKESLEDVTARANKALEDAATDAQNAQIELTKAKKLLEDIDAGVVGDAVKLNNRVNELAGQIETLGWSALYYATVNGFEYASTREYPLEVIEDEYNVESYGILIKLTEIDPEKLPGKYGFQLVKILYPDAQANPDNDAEISLFWPNDTDGVNAKWYLSADDGFDPDEDTHYIFTTDERYGVDLHYGAFVQYSDDTVNDVWKLDVTRKVKYAESFYDVVEGKISDKLTEVNPVNNTVFTAYRELTDRQISSKVSATDLDTKLDKYSTIDQTATDISLAVGVVNTDLETVKQSYIDLDAELIKTGVFDKDENGNYKLSEIDLDPSHIALKVVEEHGDDLTGSMIEILKNKITFQANAEGREGVTLTLNGEATNATLTGDMIVTGTMISDAVATHGITIQDGQNHNITTLTSDGDLTIGEGTAGESFFGHDGNGYIANGLITWGKVGTAVNYSGVVASKLLKVTDDYVINVSNPTDFQRDDETKAYCLKNVTGGICPARKVISLDRVGNQILVQRDTVGQVLIDLPSYVYGATVSNTEVGSTFNDLVYTKDIEPDDDEMKYITWVNGFIGSTFVLYTTGYSNAPGSDLLYLRGVDAANFDHLSNWRLYSEIANETTGAPMMLIFQCVYEHKTHDGLEYPSVVWKLVGKKQFGQANQGGAIFGTIESENTISYV